MPKRKLYVSDSQTRNTCGFASGRVVGQCLGLSPSPLAIRIPSWLNIFVLKVLTVTFFFLTSTLWAFDGFYLGAQVGQVGLHGKNLGPFSNSLGFGLDMGVRANPLLDIVAQFQRSSHSGAGNGLTLTSTTVCADFHFYQFNDIEFSMGAGPGFYFFKTDANSEANFGLHVGTNIDALIDDRVRLGVGFRYHNVFSNMGGNYWTALMRLGYHFATN